MVQFYTNIDDWPDAIAQGYSGPGWYFWDETETYCYGPYETKEIAEKKLAEYAHFLETGEITE